MTSDFQVTIPITTTNIWANVRTTAIGTTSGDITTPRNREFTENFRSNRKITSTVE